MADQHRWFKLWASAPGDEDLQALPAADRWAWAAFGVYTKVHGSRGRVTVSASNAVLAAEMGVPIDALLGTLQRLPHLHIEEGFSDNGKLTVTWENWIKYQEDSTQAARQRASRAKRRGEESRGDKKRTTPPTMPPQTDRPVPDSILKALDQAHQLGQVPRLRTIDYWRANIRATNGHVEYAQEILKAEAWLSANPSRAPRKDLARFLHNWLSRAGEQA